MPHIHRTGPVDQITVPVKLTGAVPTSTIQQGDLVAMVSGFAVPATVFPWTTDEATTQAAFAAVFVGMSNARSRVATTDARDLEIGVTMSGEIEMDSVSAVYNVGDYVGCNSSASLLLQQVKGVATKARSIGIVVRKEVTATTRILVRLITVDER